MRQNFEMEDLQYLRLDWQIFLCLCTIPNGTSDPTIWRITISVNKTGKIPLILDSFYNWLLSLQTSTRLKKNILTSWLITLTVVALLHAKIQQDTCRNIQSQTAPHSTSQPQFKSTLLKVLQLMKFQASVRVGKIFISKKLSIIFHRP